MPSFDDVESLRAFYRQRVAASSLRAVARAADLNHATLKLFVDGTTERPSGEMLDRLRGYAESWAGAHARNGAPPSDVERMPGYWIGRLAQIVEHHERVGAELRAFLDAGGRWEVGSATAGAHAPTTPEEMEALGMRPSRAGKRRPADEVAAENEAAAQEAAKRARKRGA